jgi:ubiquinone/menaquinone biosynthesis C-methylase UbiE
MSADAYQGKSAYRGPIASRYDEDRTVEAIWGVEQAFVGRWIATLPEGSSLLDVPAGTGRFIELCKNRGLKVWAFDVSADMVAQIHRRYPDSAREMQVAVGDAEQLALPDNAVEYVLSWRFFHLIPAPVVQRVLKEFHRVCRGTVVVQVFAVRPGFWGRVAAGLRRRLGRKPAAVTATLPAAEPASPWAHIENFSHTESDLRAQFTRAGFVLDRAETIEVQHGLPNRVYFLRRAGAASGRA